MTTLGDSIEDFLMHLGELNRSPRTREAYQAALARLSHELAASGLDARSDLSALTPLHLRRFSRALFTSGLAPRSRAQILSAVRSWLRYLAKNGETVPSPDLIELPKINREPPELDERLPETVASPLPPRRFEGADILALRDRAIIQTLFSTQLRVSELCSLDRDQIDRERGLAVVVGKGRKTRTVFFGPDALAANDDYLAARDDHHRPLFLRHDRARVEPDPAVDPRGESLRVTVSSVERVVRRTTAARGILATPHSYRHYGATAMVRAGMDLRSVQEALGHASVATTQIYTHVNPRRMQQDWQRYHPAAKPGEEAETPSPPFPRGEGGQGG